MNRDIRRLPRLRCRGRGLRRSYSGFGGFRSNPDRAACRRGPGQDQ
ncbi:hypothetical protein LC55x_3377 [Lysobacter capsici]|nr:hypothetical protein LC55x_3377 [Lysobacter capsici]